MTIKQIKKESISEQVFEQLKQQLLNNEWKQGEKIPSENDLAEAFGVSRVTVRQAIQKLTILGLLETRVGEGSFVKQVNAGITMNAIIPYAYLGENSLDEVLEFRSSIESGVAGLAAEKITDEDIQELENCYKEMELYKNDLELFAKKDFDFHLIIINATKNSLYIQLFNIIYDVLYKAMTTVVHKKGNSAGLYYHKLLLDAFKKRNSKEVKRIMDEHMRDNDKAYNKKA